ncbi:acetyl/propionyl/methylcrotonyl-CoA carboxylase subunit alpha [Achromobacter sp. MFA1 R4]|uniref:acetyl-CoA carboxylase biotin carboxylase subunit n=1 Tax=Achromobacter sp. MFA1 R4 TaxID=1881016 RepID=UPI0009536BB8|nr:biotin carboxylase N-terminal domain-containing protein [Achromobacter sp. MFA1 R4]SIT25979.1 acetyl-CoA carboxylase, biotin carboxylase subunit [Achromobacter sp. MFA1 R4]
MKRVIVANRGAVARRVIRALRALGIESVAVHAEADRDMPYLSEADLAVPIGPSPAVQSYLNQETLLRVARETGADGLHPGYGFLSENAAFAEAVEQAGLIFVGPSPRWIRMLGHKTQARDAMRALGMPMAPSSAVLGDDLAALRQAAGDLGYPVLIKPASGGGGIGMIPLQGPQDAEAQWARARQISERSFGGGSDLYLEKLLRNPRHVEFQFLADRHGQVRCLYERDCSTQRRHQKVLEEAPAPGLPRAALKEMGARLEAMLAGMGYDVIGTVEMLYTPESGFSFLEINTRLQVEHAVTEAVTGVDIVAAQLRLAAGDRMQDVLPQVPPLDGHAVEARVYAEDPVRFLPSPGLLRVFQPPAMPGVRVETGYAEGCRVSSHYDPMLAKVIAHAATREQALDLLRSALAQFRVEGVKTNIPFVLRVVEDPEFRAGRVSTGMAERILAEAQPA